MVPIQFVRPTPSGRLDTRIGHGNPPLCAAGPHFSLNLTVPDLLLRKPRFAGSRLRSLEHEEVEFSSIRHV